MTVDETRSRSSDPLTPIELLKAGSDWFCQLYKLNILAIAFERIVVCNARGRRISRAYMAAPRIEVAAVPAYRAFREETARQFHFLTSPRHLGGLAVSVEVVEVDPYHDAADMIRDLRDNHRLKVYRTAGCRNEHPLLTNDENDMLRAVHDAFGHAAIGRGFDPDGEEAAWLKHSSMYSPLARLALTTETRGQNSALTFYYQGRAFPEQKAALLPEEFSDPRNVTLAGT